MAKRKTSQVGASGKVSGTPKAKDLPPPKIKKITWAQERFIEEYIHNGGNATQAYLASHPGCTYVTANAHGPRYAVKCSLLQHIDAKRDTLRKELNFDKNRAIEILVGMATASLDDFQPVLKDPTKRSKYVGLGNKRFAAESAKQTITFTEDGGEKITNEVKIISPGERKAVINELWDKLGLGEEVSKGNWFDGIERIAELVRGTEKK